MYRGAQPLFCSLTLLFSDVPVAVEVFLNSLIYKNTTPLSEHNLKQAQVTLSL